MINRIPVFQVVKVSKNLRTLQVGGEVITIETKDKNGREDTIDFFSEGEKFPEDVLKVFGVERN